MFRVGYCLPKKMIKQLTQTLLSDFCTYTVITAKTPGPNNILALSSATSHVFRQSNRVLPAMRQGFLIVM